MELSILLAEQILSMFLTMIVGYIIVKIGLFKVIFVQHGKMVNMKEQEKWMK